MISPRLIARLRRHGIVHPVLTVQAARIAGIPLSLACAVVDQESAGGHNIFGHDPTIFVGAGQVTKTKYLSYKRQRGTSHMQGVGPCQLTWWEVQDKADQRGGCWKPKINMIVGFQLVATNIKSHGSVHDGLRAYNGTGAAAENYANQVTHRQQAWHEILIGKVK